MFEIFELTAYLCLAIYAYESYEDMVGQVVGQASRFLVGWVIGTYFSFICGRLLYLKGVVGRIPPMVLYIFGIVSFLVLLPDSYALTLRYSPIPLNLLPN